MSVATISLFQGREGHEKRVAIPRKQGRSLPSEKAESGSPEESPPSSSNEQARDEQRDEGFTFKQDKSPVEDAPDVVLDVPVLNVDEIDLEVDDLKAHVSLRAELADLVKVNVGVDVYLGKVKLEIKGVEAQALLKVRLERILSTLDRALEAIEKNPQILGETARGVEQAAEDAGQITDRAVGQSGETAGQQAAEESANTTKSGLDQDSEETPGNLSGLQIEEEYIDEEGRIVGRAVDESGNIVEDVLDEAGNVQEPDASEEKEREAEYDDDTEVSATDAAKRKARELGVRLSEVEGTGSNGRILVEDVEKAAR